MNLSILIFFVGIFYAIARPQHGNYRMVMNGKVDKTEIGCVSLAMAEDANIIIAPHPVDDDLEADVSFTIKETQCGSISEKDCSSNGSEDLFDKKITKDQELKKFNFVTNSSGMYIVVISIERPVELNFTFSIKMRNSFGYLSLVDYPAMIVYSLLLVVYIAYAIFWLVSLLCSYKDIVRLHFWILAVILLGFMEKIFFVAEYGTANSGIDSPGIIYIAEGVSAAKRALARVLLIIVCEGFGTVKPRLGSTLTGVVVVGIVYFVVAFIDGTMRASKVTTESHDLMSFITYGILILIDTGIAYWIFSAIVATRRALRVRKNVVKLSLYNHLGYALIATIIASGVFVVWQIIVLTRNDCTKDWREVWLMECFWHILFCFILLVIMIIWRPSAHQLRFVYSQVHDEDPEGILDDQGPNKNFDSVKMRPVSKEVNKPNISSQEAEEDLQWVEQNLPTTAIDKILPALLDSEEEVMTTRFESSKLH